MKKLLLEVLTSKQKKNVVLYGAQQRERTVFGQQSLFRVYNMDLDMGVTGQEGVLHSLEEASKVGVDAFVIMRQMIANQQTFRQILEYCSEHSADIFDENGRNIGEICNVTLKKEYCSKKQLLETIKKHEYISFDIFDTLLTRKVLMPENVFDIVALRLQKAGVCIKEFRAKLLSVQSNLGLTNPDIYDIYKAFQKKYRLSDETVEMCLRTEMEVEQELILPRNEMLEIYNNCISEGKKVCLVSDMYIPEKLLTPILKKNGITGYEDIYISCDRKQLKLQGLLETYQKDKGIEKNLHIGDHLIHDGICAGLAGMDYCLVENSYKAALRCGFDKVIERATSLEESIILGLVVSKVNNSPFAIDSIDGDIIIENDYDYGYAYCAPIISQFAVWMYKQIKQDKYDDILFASRDGYLMQQLYEILKAKDDADDMPDGKYFYTSRKAAFMTGMNNEAAINTLINASLDMPPQKMMKEKFGLARSQILEYDVARYGDSIHRYAWEHVECIKKRSEIARRNYFKYMSAAGLEIGKRYAFMDFVSSGTSQRSLQRIAPFEMIGLYAGWNGDEDEKEIQVKSFYTNKDAEFMRRFKEMETFMSSQEPSINHFDDNGRPVFARQDRNEKEILYVKEMQRACIDFLEDALAVIGNVQWEMEDSSVTDMIFAVGKKAKIINEESVLNALSLMDDWGRERHKVSELVGEINLNRTEEYRSKKEIASRKKVIENGERQESINYTDWDSFCQMTSIREGLLNWYPFNDNASILHVSHGNGALVGLLSRKANHLDVFENVRSRADYIRQRYENNVNMSILTGEPGSLPVIGGYDYIVVEEAVNTKGELQKMLEEYETYLKSCGKILFTAVNRFGMKYWCGAPDPINHRIYDGIRGKVNDGLLTRQDLIHFFEQSEVWNGFQLYYPFPDHILPQAIYTDAYLPKTSVRDRVIPYYTEQEKETLICLENEISDELIANGVFHIFANSFLVECSKVEFEADVIYAALSTDRGEAHGFATVIDARNTVRKKALYRKGKGSLEIMHQNQKELVRHGVECVEEILLEDAIVMPYVKKKTLIEYLKDLFVQRELVKIIIIFDQLYERILWSSEEARIEDCPISDVDWKGEEAGKILKKAYIDMIPYNCFYDEGRLLFYDQEFVKENYPAKYVLFRALRYTYIYIPEAESILPIQFFKDKYGFGSAWKAYEREEARFVEDNRNYEELAAFYKNAGVTQSDVDANVERFCNGYAQEKSHISIKRKVYDLDTYKKDLKLSAVKTVQVDLLKRFMSVCEEYDLSCCVFYGTLLGAIRHKGFVPWDDDVDLLMPRKDYDKLLELAPKVFEAPYFLQTPENDEEFFCGGYSKFRNSNTTALEEKNSGHKCNQGIWIDILPLDYIPEDENAKREQYEQILFFQRMLLKKTYPEKRILLELTEQEEVDFWRMSRHYNREELCERLRKAITNVADEHTEHVAILSRYYCGMPYREYDASDFEYLIKADFEQIQVYIPNGYERCLEKDYGKEYYMYPPEEFRKAHHQVEYDVKKPYIDYI